MTATTTRAAETWAHMLAAVDPMPVCVALDYAQEGVTFEEARAAVEAVAQQHLDAHPDDHAARRLLGEWLQACGDERGEGLCALGACENFPEYTAEGWTWFRDESPELEYLPQDWFALIDLSACIRFGRQQPLPLWADWPTRRAAEDAASLAFLRLPESRRAALLKGEM